MPRLGGLRAGQTSPSIPPSTRNICREGSKSTASSRILIHPLLKSGYRPDVCSCCRQFRLLERETCLTTLLCSHVRGPRIPSGPGKQKRAPRVEWRGRAMTNMDMGDSQRQPNPRGDPASRPYPLPPLPAAGTSSSLLGMRAGSCGHASSPEQFIRTSALSFWVRDEVLDTVPPHSTPNCSSLSTLYILPRLRTFPLLLLSIISSVSFYQTHAWSGLDIACRVPTHNPNPEPATPFQAAHHHQHHHHHPNHSPTDHQQP
jgi:hypothetical protein